MPPDPSRQSASLFADLWACRRQVLLLVAVAGLLRLAIIAALPVSITSVDLLAWQNISQLLEKNLNPYVETQNLNWPPLWMQCIWIIRQISESYGISFTVAARGLLTAFDLVAVVVFYTLGLVLRSGRPPTRWILWGVVLNPVLLLLTCVHGNFDVLLAIFVAATITALLRYRQTLDPMCWLWASAFLGFGILSKTVPLILIPLLFIGIRHIAWPTRLLGLLLVLVPTTVGLSTLFVMTPSAITNNVLKYRAIGGYFGISGTLSSLHAYTAMRLHAAMFGPLLLTVVAVLSVIAIRLRPSARLYAALPLPLFLGVLICGTGYGPQYGWWLVAPAIAMAHALPSMRRPIFAVYSISIVHYLFEYSVNINFGFMLYNFFPSAEHLQFAQQFQSNIMQTLIRGPLFLSYLVLLIWSLVAIIRNPVDDTPTSQDSLQSMPATSQSSTPIA